MQPTIGVDGLGSLLRVVEIPPEDVATSGDDLAVFSKLHLGARHGAAYGPRPHCERIPGHQATGLAHSVDLRKGNAEPAEEVEDLDRNRRRTADRGDALVESERFANGTQRAVGSGERFDERRRQFLASSTTVGSLEADRDRRVELRLAIRIGAGHRHDPGVNLLPHARHREEHLGPYVREILRDLAWLGTRRYFVPERDTEIVRDVPLGDVRHRQIGHETRTFDVDVTQRLAQTLHGPRHVGVIDHHTLRRTGCP